MSVQLVKGSDATIYLEPWLTKQGLADYLACGTRWIEQLMADYRGKSDPFPAREIAGRIKFRASEVEAWLERHGHMKEVA